MKSILYVATLSIFFLLISCNSNRNVTVDADFTREIWKPTVEHSPTKWTYSADRWFLTGEPNAYEIANQKASSSAAITTSVVHTENYNKVEANGGFQVQIFQSDRNSVFVYGPNAGAHAVGIKVVGTTLTIRQTDKVPERVMRRVIVRVGIKKLNRLLQLGSGPVSVSQIHSKYLCIQSEGSGNTFVSGDVNIRRVVSKGAGCIFIFGADTKLLDIYTAGKGQVNICGKLGVRSIVHHGSGNINLIGVRTKRLSIYADGSGKIGLCGWYINLCGVTAKDKTCVYVYDVYGNHVTINTYGKAQVGLNGKVGDLYINAKTSSVFLGRYLCARQAFVTATESAHVNVTARNRLFARASQSASIYFFGPSTLMDAFATGSGEIIPIGGRNACNFGKEYRPYDYTPSYLGENVLFKRNIIEESCGQSTRSRKYKGAG